LKLYLKNLKEENSMKRLEENIRKNGFDYTLVKRGQRSCIYKQKVTESVSYYEVFLIKVKKKRTVKGKILPAREVFPHDEAFGYWAWSIRDYSRALKRFHELENLAESKKNDIPKNTNGQYNIFG